MGRKAEWDKQTFYESKPSINDWMMRRLGLPIVWGWLIAALAIVGYGIYDPNSVMPMLEGFISLLAIVGTLATLIVTSMLELWKSEQQKEIETMELRMKHQGYGNGSIASRTWYGKRCSGKSHAARNPPKMSKNANILELHRIDYGDF